MDSFRVDFRSTCWSRILRLRDPDDGEYQDAFERLIGDYWRPIYSYVRRRGHPAHAAEDLTQSFFTGLFERDALRHLQQEGGTFRGYLRKAVDRFLVSDHRYRTREKRTPPKRLIPLDNLEAQLAPTIRRSEDPPEVVFERQWALDVLRLARERMKALYHESGREVAFEVFRRFVLAEERDRRTITQQELAEEHGLTVDQVNNTIHRGKAAFGNSIRLVIADYVTDASEVDEEVAALQQWFG